MSHQESSPVLSTPDITQTTRDAGGKLWQVNENASYLTLNICTLKIAEIACVIIWKLNLAHLRMVSQLEEDVVTSTDLSHIFHFVRALRCSLSLMVLEAGTGDLGQLTLKSIILVSYNKGLIIITRV